MKASLKDAVDRIKSAGFSHIKVELEANIGRDGELSCDSCDGNGGVDCSDCEGEGAVQVEEYIGNSYRDNWVECDSCGGDGLCNCDDCDGTGNRGNFMNESTCEEFMRDYVPQDVRDRLVYGQFYEDGSVDSEFTLTIAIEHIEDVLLWMDAFKALCDECNGYLDVSDAGLHITVLPDDSDGKYPCYREMNRTRVRNFSNQMTKLMPALFFLASSGHQSRSLEYRHPQVTPEKYSAISTHDDTCYEFRVFETCYDKPESFYDYVETIANCLKFHADPSLSVKNLGKEFGFNNGESVARFYNTAEQLRILNSTVKHIKPKDKTYKKLKEERGVHYTIKDLNQKEKAIISKLREEYKQYQANVEQARSKPLNELQEMNVRKMMVDNWSRESAENYVRGLGKKILTLREFVRENMPSRRSYDEFITV